MITRRTAIQLGMTATTALVCDPLIAKQTPAPKLLTRPIPSSGERLPLSRTRKEHLEKVMSGG